MTWIRVESGIRGSAKIRRFATDLKIAPAAAVGHLVLLWGQVAEHVSSGDLSNTQDELLEEWALWTGRRGRFAKAYRAAFAPSGTIHDWQEHQGKLIERRMRDRERKRHSVGNSVEVPVEAPQEIRGASSGMAGATVRNGNGTETTQRQPGGREADWETEVRTLLPVDYHPDLDAVLRGSQRPVALIAELRVILRGERAGSEDVTPEQVGMAIRDCTLAPGPLTGKKLAGFIRGAKHTASAPHQATSGPVDEYEAARRRFAKEDGHA